MGEQNFEMKLSTELVVILSVSAAPKIEKKEKLIGGREKGKYEYRSFNP
jgi:hypothetical protein